MKAKLTLTIASVGFATLAAAAAAPAAPHDAVTARPAAGKVVAVVNGENITLADVESARDGSSKPEDAVQVLDRLVGVELVVQEARRMGLQDSLEVSDQLGIFERDALRDGLFARRLEKVRPDPKDVERLVAAMTTEVRIRSALYHEREDAERLAARTAGGEDFDTVAKQLADGKKGQLDPGDRFIRISELRPEVQQALAPLSSGGVSAVYAVDGQFAISRLIERRAAPDPDAKAKAGTEALQRAQLPVMTAYVDELTKRYVTVDEKLVASLDFDAKDPGFVSYLKDPRPVATIEGEPPIAVSDLTDAVRKRLFHGAGRASDKGRLNAKKVMVLDDLIAKRVVLKEARRLGLDKAHAYLALKDQVERELLFGTFVAKVIVPEAKVSDADVRAYYDAHRAEFTVPEMIRLDALAFDGRKAAEEALDKLRSGADLAWLRLNAPGRLDAAAIPAALSFPSAPLTWTDLPGGVKQSLTGAAAGDYRVFATAEGPAAVLLVRERLPGVPQPLERVDGEIRTKLAGEKRRKAFDDYVAQLRKASEVRKLVRDDELRQLIPPIKRST